MLTVNHSSIPSYLKSIPQWCVWRADKVPKDLDGNPLKSTEPHTWCSFAGALEAYTTDGWDGIGFCLTGSGITGIDLDDCFSPDGRLKAWGKKVVDFFESHYKERSPSGTGLHILVREPKPSHITQCKRALTNADGTKIGEIEVYDTARYFTVTGVRIGEGTEILTSQGLIADFCKRLWPDKLEAQPVVSQVEPQVINKTGPNVNKTEDIVTLILSSSQAVKFKALTTGSLESAIGPYGNDHSRAVDALTAILAWWTDDFSVVDRIVKSSPLYDGKWAPNPEGKGRASRGKWLYFGQRRFDQLRGRYVTAGNVFDGDIGKVSAATEFANQAGVGDEPVDAEAHIALLLERGELRRDLLSSSLHIRPTKTGVWEPVFTRSFIGSIKGECRVRGKPLKSSAVEDLLYRHEQNSEPTMLLDIPAWDGVGRIEEMCSKIQLESVHPKTHTEITLDWMCKLWGKIHKPDAVQNRCILLSGGQGVGKDVWVRSLLCGLGKYMSDLVTNGKHTTESDLAVVMGQSICLFVSEFDKTDSLGPGVLKDLITKPSFTSVRKYDRDATTTPNRCSVIAACNPEHVLNDSTGNRRFLLFRLAGKPGEAIKWEYPVLDKGYSLQILSQAKHLFESGYKSSSEAEEEMRQIQAEHTPECTEELIVCDFEAMIKDKVGRNEFDGVNPGLYRIDELDKEFVILCRNHGISRRNLLTTLKAQGCQKRVSSCRLYGTRIAIQTGKIEYPSGVAEEDWI
jgi:predicted P-loop ATPase